MRVDAGATGNDVEYPLDGAPGGRFCKVTQFMVKVLQKSNGNVKLGFKVRHGPDGQAYATHTSISSQTVPADDLMVFDGAGAILGEWTRGVVVAGGTAPGDWMVIEVFEMRKPF
jgi:hypothetical protein